MLGVFICDEENEKSIVVFSLQQQGQNCSAQVVNWREGAGCVSTVHPGLGLAHVCHPRSGTEQCENFMEHCLSWAMHRFTALRLCLQGSYNWRFTEGSKSEGEEKLKVSPAA